MIERNIYRLFKRDAILEKLAQFAAEGKIAQIAKLLRIRPDLRIEVLFTLAGLGAQDEMKAILIEHPEDLLVSHHLRDISGAEFSSITLLQHAIWTKDVRYMANMFLDCLPKNEQGEKIRVALEQQVKEHMAKGVVYQLKGVEHKERHFNLQPLIIALHTYVENYNHWTEEQRKEHWCTVVGLAQTLIPAHIRHHYCDPEEAFWNNPNFKKPKLKRSLEVYNWILEKSQLWSESLAGLGSDFGIYAGLPLFFCGGGGGCTARAVFDGSPNLAALQALDKTRTEIDLPALIERLHISIQNMEDELDCGNFRAYN
ncbi:MULTISPECIES: hypothetical protein [unclassified Legionella]|uniref:hypothetical protein n=1 Tax=unclassified Legionella TaxID=2622702 RepID=UPI003AF64670